MWERENRSQIKWNLKRKWIFIIIIIVIIVAVNIIDIPFDNNNNNIYVPKNRKSRLRGRIEKILTPKDRPFWHQSGNELRLTTSQSEKAAFGNRSYTRFSRVALRDFRGCFPEP